MKFAPIAQIFGLNFDKNVGSSEDFVQQRVDFRQRRNAVDAAAEGGRAGQSLGVPREMLAGFGQRPGALRLHQPRETVSYTHLACAERVDRAAERVIRHLVDKIGIRDPRAVSYTHLDVYKRQA